ncbi:MAG: UbiA family prenyltransferase, partial [Acidobacteriota bacterium]|nr:UbiA family prenyltransferase [Acidobacteriota bacterium]
MLSTAAYPSRLHPLFLSLRPTQWTKNLIVFAALVFGGRELSQRGGDLQGAAADSVAAFVIFCALSSVMYLFNDVRDREADRLHPRKAARPIASGALPVRDALA